MSTSILMCTYNRYELTRNTLTSIFKQNYPCEVVVVDDGSSDNSERLRDEFNIHYIKCDEHGYGNQSKAMNIAIRNSHGDIVIMQSSDVIHVDNVIANLVKGVEKDDMIWCFAKVANMINGRVKDYLTSSTNPRPFFFLSSIWKKHLEAVGGLDEDYVLPGYDDKDLADRLIKGLGIRPVFRDDIHGIHQEHERPDRTESYKQMRALYKEKTRLWKAGKINHVRNI